MSSSFRKIALIGAVCGSAAVGGSVTTILLDRSSTAHAESPNTATSPVPQTPPKALEAAGDISATFKSVNKAVEPSVVQITTRATVAASENPLRRFFQFGLPGGNEDDNGPDGIPTPPGGGGEGGGEPGGGGGGFAVGTGSGVIMLVSGSEGYILTNNHVVQNADTLTVKLHDGREITDAKVVGTDPRTDLAVVKITAPDLTPARWGDSSQLEQGDWVMAFGSPFGYGGTMTHGIVSALNRRVGILGQFGFEDFIQTDAPINPGNSGGPLVNVRGEVVGINQSIASRSGGFSGLGFAVPSKLARPIFEQLKADGKIVRGYLGVQIRDVSLTDAQARDEIAATGFKGDKGAFVAGTVNGGPAWGKLKSGDIITAVNGKSVATSDELRSYIAATKPDTDVKLSVFRNGSDTSVTVRLGEQPSGDSPTASSRFRRNAPGVPNTEQAKGLNLRDMDPALAKTLGLDAATTGAAIAMVAPNSAASRAGLRPGDVITSIDGADVSGATDAAKALREADLSRGVRMTVVNRDGSRFVLLRDK